ncbi:MAG: aspartate carbamoyltransferase, partial [Verrucomicrobiae bacterium]|nr:aspartate carbamoyltransferase [Verrucomicrobiae bacterium]
DLGPLRKLEGKSIVSVNDFDQDVVIELAKLAAILENYEITPYHLLDGKIVITAFFEASTRTRLSFESSTQRLAGRILSIPEGGVTGAKKGESLEDIGEMFNAYCDLVILRHTETDSIKRIQRNLRVPLINAGNGSGEHPTQALADWYALLKWNPALANGKLKSGRRLHIGILGTPGSMRAVKSFLFMTLLFQSKVRKVTVVSEMADPFGEDVIQALSDAHIDYDVTYDLQESLADLDVIYMNSIAFLGDSYKKLDSRFKLDNRSALKKDAVILHPLARLDELDTSLDDTSHNLYFSQAHGAVFVREALLISVMGRLDRLPEDIPTIN